MVEIYALPELACCLRQHVLRLEDGDESLRELPVEIDMAKHDPGVMPTNCHARDSAACSSLDAPFCSLSRSIDGSILGFVDMVAERILCKVVIRGTDVGIPEDIAHAPERAIVVAGCIFGVHDNADAEFLLEIEEILFLVADNDRDIVDACLLELADLALDEHLSPDLQEALRLLVGDGCKTRREACRHDDSIVDAIGLERSKSSRRDGAIFRELLFRQLVQRLVDRSQGQSSLFCNLPLARLGRIPVELIEHFDFPLLERHSIPFRRCSFFSIS